MTGKRWTNHEVKCGCNDRKPPLAQRERELREKNPNKFEVHNIGCNNPLHLVREVKRKFF